MKYYALEQLGDDLTFLIKNASWFPYKSGHLKFDATRGAMFDSTTYRINFSDTVAPYVVYLEEGTGPHDIFPVTRKALKFKVGGKTVFATRVHHPGSTKHKGFISEKCVETIVEYIATKYRGVVSKVW